MTVRGAETSAPKAHVLQSIASASKRTGVPFNYLLNQAKTESGLNPTAKAPTSSATGLFQFTNQTWLATVATHGEEHGLSWASNAIQRNAGGTFSVSDPQLRQQILDLRFDPAASAAMAGEFASDNANTLRQQLGREVDQTDLSIAHFLGAHGARKFLVALQQSPAASAAAYFPEAAEANRSVFYDKAGSPRSLLEIHSRFAAKANAPTGASPEPQTQLAIQTVQREHSSTVSQGARWSGRMPEIEPMPSKLSLTFAEAAYRKLSNLGGAAS